MKRRTLSLALALAAACCAAACGGKVFIDLPGNGGGGSAGGSGGDIPTGTCVECAGQCTDLSHDAQNCGACDHDCPLTQICQGGHCLQTPCSIPGPCSSCCGDQCCGLEELCCGNASIGFSCISSEGETACPVITCGGGCGN